MNALQLAQRAAAALDGAPLDERHAAAWMLVEALELERRRAHPIPAAVHDALLAAGDTLIDAGVEHVSRLAELEAALETMERHRDELRAKAEQGVRLLEAEMEKVRGLERQLAERAAPPATAIEVPLVDRIVASLTDLGLPGPAAREGAELAIQECPDVTDESKIAARALGHARRVVDRDRAARISEMRARFASRVPLRGAAGAKASREETIQLIWALGPVSVDELASTFVVSKNAVRKRLAPLKEEGIIARVEGDDPLVELWQLTENTRRELEAQLRKAAR